MSAQDECDWEPVVRIDEASISEESARIWGVTVDRAFDIRVAGITWQGDLAAYRYNFCQGGSVGELGGYELESEQMAGRWNGSVMSEISGRIGEERLSGNPICAIVSRSGLLDYRLRIT